MDESKEAASEDSLDESTVCAPRWAVATTGVAKLALAPPPAPGVEWRRRSSLARHSERGAGGGLASITLCWEGGDGVGSCPGNALEQRVILGESFLQTL